MTTASLKVPFLEYSSFTLAIEPVFTQVMFWTVLTPHFSPPLGAVRRSEEHTSELQSPCNLVCRLLLEKKKTTTVATINGQNTLVAIICVAVSISPAESRYTLRFRDTSPQDNATNRHPRQAPCILRVH